MRRRYQRFHSNSILFLSLCLWCCCVPDQNKAQSAPASRPSARAATTLTTPPKGTLMTRALFAFQEPKKRGQWMIINDDVMGGISQSKMTISSEKHALFTGHVSMDNNGGFASVRSETKNFELDDFAGIQLRIRGDAKVYQFRIRTNSGFDGVAYRQRFQTKGGWQTVYLPFQKFEPSFRGRLMPSAGPLVPSKIRSLGILIADKQEGSFRLEIATIKAYKSQRKK